MSMSTETRLAIVEHAVRWAGNMLNEVVSNHHHALTDEQRAALKRASSALTDFSLAKRPPSAHTSILDSKCGNCSQKCGNCSHLRSAHLTFAGDVGNCWCACPKFCADVRR